MYQLFRPYSCVTQVVKSPAPGAVLGAPGSESVTVVMEADLDWAPSHTTAAASMPANVGARSFIGGHDLGIVDRIPV